MLLDANILLYAVDRASPHHPTAATWLEDALNGARRIALPWQTIGAFLRISTHPRITTSPLHATQAMALVDRWLRATPTWIPPVTERTAHVLAELYRDTTITGNLVPDAQLAAIALEHGLVVCSTDADFARFPGVRWHDPLRG